MFFFFNDTATTEIYTLSLHDALPISTATQNAINALPAAGGVLFLGAGKNFLVDKLAPKSNKTVIGYGAIDRKSTRLNSSHDQISYAVFCLKKKKKDTSVAIQSACYKD